MGRVCKVCGQEKELDEFDSKCKGGVLWRDFICLQCRNMGRRLLKDMLVENYRKNHKKIPPHLKE
jgi:hypothetical protein